MQVALGPILFWLLIYGAVCMLFGFGVTWLIWPWIHRRGTHRRGSDRPAAPASRHAAAHPTGTSAARRSSMPPRGRTEYTGGRLAPHPPHQRR